MYIDIFQSWLWFISNFLYHALAVVKYQIPRLRYEFVNDGDDEVAKEDDNCWEFLTLIQLLKLSRHYDWLRLQKIIAFKMKE